MQYRTSLNQPTAIMSIAGFVTFAARTVAVCFLVSGMVLPGLAASAAESLFLPAGAVEQAPALQAGQKRARIAQFNAQLLEVQSPLRRTGLAAAASGSRDITLNLFADKSYAVRIDRIESKNAGRFTAWGHVPGVPQSQIILSVCDGEVAGAIHIPGENPCQIFPQGNGRQQVIELDPASVPQCGSGDIVVPGGAIPVGAGPAPAADGGNVVVDVMVVYTSAARTGAGGVAGINSSIDLAVAEANTTFANSGVNITLRLVYGGEVTYTETGTASTDLDRLRISNDGYLDTVHALRTQYGADLVCLLVENMATYAGLGYVMSPVSSGFSSYAFTVVKRMYASGYYVFAHELGHNMGCQHNLEDAGSAGAYPYSYGHRFNTGGTDYRTVMSYGNTYMRIPHFSNPEVSYLGTSTGVATNLPNPANNALGLNNAAATVAAFASSVPMIAFDGAGSGFDFDAVTTNVLESGGTVPQRPRLRACAGHVAHDGIAIATADGGWTACDLHGFC